MELNELPDLTPDALAARWLSVGLRAAETPDERQAIEELLLLMRERAAGVSVDMDRARALLPWCFEGEQDD